MRLATGLRSQWCGYHLDITCPKVPFTMALLPWPAGLPPTGWEPGLPFASLKDSRKPALTGSL